jgi:hypothetical protein
MVAPLSVKWADTDLRARRNNQKGAQQAGGAAATPPDAADGRTVRGRPRAAGVLSER